MANLPGNVIVDINGLQITIASKEEVGALNALEKDRDQRKDCQSKTPKNLHMIGMDIVYQKNT